MHTVKLIASGMLLLTIFLLCGLWLAGPQPQVTARSASLFVPVWLIASAINMWIGVKRGGYSVADEVPFFLVVFGVPAIAAGLLWWRYAGG